MSKRKERSLRLHKFESSKGGKPRYVYLDKYTRRVKFVDDKFESLQKEVKNKNRIIICLLIGYILLGICYRTLQQFDILG